MKRTIVVSAVALAAAGAAAVFALSGAGASAAEIKAPAVAAVAPLDLAAEPLSYAKQGDTVTVTRQGTVVATIGLESARYTTSSGTAVFAVDARQPVLVDTAMFTLYDANGGENTATDAAPVTLAAGRHALTLQFDGTGTPQAVGWAPSDGEAVWAR